MDHQRVGKKQPEKPEHSMLPNFLVMKLDSVVMYLCVCAKKIELPAMGN